MKVCPDCLKAKGAKDRLEDKAMKLKLVLFICNEDREINV